MIFNEKYNLLLNYLLNLDEEFKACFESARVLLSKEQTKLCQTGEPFLDNGQDSIVELKPILATKENPGNGLYLAVREKAHPVRYKLKLIALNRDCLKLVLNSSDDSVARFVYRDYELCSLVCNNDEANIITEYTFYLCQVKDKYKLLLAKRLLNAEYLTTIEGGSDTFYDVENIEDLLVGNSAGVNA